MRQTIYDNFAAGYDRFFNPLEKRFLRRWREETLSYLPDNSRLLEISAGTGLNFEFYPLNCKCIASELSLIMLEFARRKIDFLELKANKYQCRLVLLRIRKEDYNRNLAQEN